MSLWEKHAARTSEREGCRSGLSRGSVAHMTFSQRKSSLVCVDEERRSAGDELG